MKSNGTKPGQTNVTSILQTYRRMSKSAFWKAKEGRNQIRILPPLEGEGGVFYREVGVHYKSKSIDILNRTFLCPFITSKSSCSICELANKLKESEDEDLLSLGDILTPKKRALMRIKNRENNEIYIWSVSKRMLRQILAFFAESGYDDITHPKNGFDLIVTRKGMSQFDTSYTLIAQPKSSELGDVNWDRVPNLDECLLPPSADEANGIQDKIEFILKNTTVAQELSQKDSKDSQEKEQKSESEEKRGPSQPLEVPNCFGKLQPNESCKGCQFLQRCEEAQNPNKEMKRNPVLGDSSSINSKIDEALKKFKKGKKG